MKSSIKFFTIFFIFLLLILPVSFATDINMNLPPENEEIENDFSNEENILMNNEEGANSILNGENILTDNESLENEPENSILTDTPSTTISSTSLEESLSFDTILNIIFIVVGIILILLGIAFLIRIHS